MLESYGTLYMCVITFIQRICMFFAGSIWSISIIFCHINTPCMTKKIPGAQKVLEKEMKMYQSHANKDIFGTYHEYYKENSSQWVNFP